ncbi:MAG: hypothetical protein A2157_06760 [Deltaproteobacteria bacterium RBG_16_47_11]|nr:MAG: hypothetical protein A2157_06760 [Deltaproteobacteria bacterium RBG_16_47_11]
MEKDKSGNKSKPMEGWNTGLMEYWKTREKRSYCRFTPYNPESPGLQTGDEGNFKSKDKEKPSPLGRGYTGFTSFNSSFHSSNRVKPHA